MDGLSARSLYVALETWADDPVPLTRFENAPRLLYSQGEKSITSTLAAGYRSRKNFATCSFATTSVYWFLSD